MSWLYRFLLRFNWFQRLVEWSQRIIPIGFDGLPLFTVLEFFFKEIRKEQLNAKSSSLAYSFLLAIFPATIFLFTLIPYIPVKNFKGELFSILVQVLPKDAFLAIQSTITDIIENQNGSLLSFGFLTALFFATNGVMALMRNFNKASLILETRKPWKQRLVATYLTMGLSLLLVAGVALIITGESILRKLKLMGIIKGPLAYYAILGTNWITIVTLFFCVISSLYYFGPATAKKFKFVSAGSTLATILSIITSLGFAYYVNNFSSYNKLYGSIGTLIVIMIWLYLNSMILLIGFELNASINIIKRNLPAPKKGNRLKTEINN